MTIPSRAIICSPAAGPDAGEQMIALDRIDILADVHFRCDQADIADVMLRAGMMAARDVDIERRVDIDARLAPVADLGGMTLCIRRRNRQPALPVQAISPARICEASTASPIFLIAAIASSTFSSRHARDQKVLPDRQADIAVAEILRDFASPRICSQVTLPSGSETPIQFNPSCFCLCTPICAMRSNAGRGAIASTARA